MQKKLIRIFYYYTTKFELNTNIEFISSENCSSFDTITNCIYFSNSLNIPDRFNIQRTNLKSINIDIYRIWSLLHELYHAIDWTKNYTKASEEWLETNHMLYATSSEYHDKQSYEIRADTFANNELKKWIKE